jgi:hypothetical protein
MDFTHSQVRTAAKRLFIRFWLSGKQGDKVPQIVHRQQHPGRLISLAASYCAGDRPCVPTWSESFIWAGGSAFLLLIVTLLPQYWYLSFFALTPFLYRSVKATSRECLRLGFILGLPFFSLSILGSGAPPPLLSVLKVLSGTALFSLFGWTAGLARQRWGFNPFILVFLWVGLEMGLVKLGFVRGLLGEAGLSHPVFGGLVTLFGFLTVSAIILLFNSLLVLAIVETLQVRRPRGRTIQEAERILNLFSTAGLFAQRVYLVPESRAPPLPSSVPA